MQEPSPDKKTKETKKKKKKEKTVKKSVTRGGVVHLMDGTIAQLAYLICAVAADGANSSDEAELNLKRLVSWREAFSEFGETFLSKPGLALGRSSQTPAWKSSLLDAAQEFPFLSKCGESSLFTSIRTMLHDGTVPYVRSLLQNFAADEQKRRQALANAEVKLFRVHIDVSSPLCLIPFSFPCSLCTSSCLCVLFSFSFLFFFSFLFLVAPEVGVLSILKCRLEVRGLFFPNLS